jgi:hypothetical protein
LAAPETASGTSFHEVKKYAALAGLGWFLGAFELHNLFCNFRLLASIQNMPYSAWRLQLAWTPLVPWSCATA